MLPDHGQQACPVRVADVGKVVVLFGKLKGLARDDGPAKLDDVRAAKDFRGAYVQGAGKAQARDNNLPHFSRPYPFMSKSSVMDLWVGMYVENCLAGSKLEPELAGSRYVETLLMRGSISPSIPASLRFIRCGTLDWTTSSSIMSCLSSRTALATLE